MRASRTCWPAKIAAPIALTSPIAPTAVAIAVTCSAQFGMASPPSDDWLEPDLHTLRWEIDHVHVPTSGGTVSPASDDLSGRSALVTGATSGMGRSIALELAAQGADVVVHGRDPGRGAESVDAITAAGGSARFVGADLGDLGDLRAVADAAGDLDILVNNAGFSVFGATADLDVERFDAIFASNVRAPYFLVATIAPGMAGRGGQHHQRQQHGGADRVGHRRGVRRYEGSASSR